MGPHGRRSRSASNACRQDELRLTPEGKRDGADDAEKSRAVIPGDLLAEIDPGEDAEYAQGDHFLNNLQLKCGELAVSKAIRGNLKAIFEKGDQPAHHDHGDERSAPVLQVPVPGDGHEDVGTDQKQDCFHTKSYHDSKCSTGSPAPSERLPHGLGWMYACRRVRILPPTRRTGAVDLGSSPRTRSSDCRAWRSPGCKWRSDHPITQNWNRIRIRPNPCETLLFSSLPPFWLRL